MLLSFAEESDSSSRTARGTVRQRKAVLTAPGDHGKVVCLCVCVWGAGDVHMYPLMCVYASLICRGE